MFPANGTKKFNDGASVAGSVVSRGTASRRRQHPGFPDIDMRSQAGSVKNVPLNNVIFQRYSINEQDLKTQEKRRKAHMDSFADLTKEINGAKAQLHQERDKIVMEHLENFEEKYAKRVGFQRGIRVATYPEFANNFIEKEINMTIFPNQSGKVLNLQSDPFAIAADICPKNAEHLFLSKDKYLQGKCPYSDVPIGDLSNVYFIEIGMHHYSNPFPVQLGLTLLYKGKPVGERKAIHGASAYHAILHPHTSVTFVEPKTILCTSDAVNEVYAQEYPELVADYDKIRTGILQSDNGNVSIPLNHPVTRWLYENAAYYKGMDPPESFTINGVLAPKVHAKESAANFAIAQLYKFIDEIVPIIDVRNLSIKLDILNGKLFEQDTASHFHQSVTKSENLRKSDLLDIKGVTLSLWTVYMFKGHYDGDPQSQAIARSLPFETQNYYDDDDDMEYYSE